MIFSVHDQNSPLDSLTETNDICVEVQMLSSHMKLSRKGHLDQVLHIFVYLKKHHNAEMVFDSSRPEIEMEPFIREDWSQSI